MIKSILPVCLINLERRRKANCVIRSRIFYIPHYLLILGFVASGLQLPTVAHAQSFRIVDVGNGCKTYDLDDLEKPFRHVWSGECSNGYTDGWGVLKRYKGNKLAAIGYGMHKQGSLVTDQVSETYYRPKLIAKNSSNLKDNIVQSKADPKQGTVENIVPPSQVPEWAREIVDGRPRQTTPANIASQQPAQNSVSASPTAPASKTTSKNSSPVSSARSRLFVAYSEEVARPFLVSGEAMLPNVVSSYINRRTADYSQQGGPPRMRTEECHPGAGAGPYFAFIQYHLSGMPIGGLRTGWGVACGANSPDEAVRASQRACESRSSYCRVQRGLDKENQVELIIGDMRTQGEPRVIENFSVRLKESRPDGGADVGDVINYDDTWHNIPEGFVCRWNSTWGDRHRNFLIHANGPFIKKQVGFRSQYLIDFRCSSFLPLY